MKAKQKKRKVFAEILAEKLRAVGIVDIDFEGEWVKVRNGDFEIEFSTCNKGRDIDRVFVGKDRWEIVDTEQIASFDTHTKPTTNGK